MKKDKKGFEDRYGDDAKSVMYATATKLAKEDVTLQDADGNDFLEVVDLIKPDPIKGVATEQKELEPKEKPEPTVDQEPSKENQQIKKKEKKVNMMKRQILMKKMQAVRSGAGGDIVAHHEPEGEMVEGLVSMVKKGAKRHAKAVEKKKIKDRKAVPYAALGASYEPEGEVIDERLGGKGYKPYTSLTGKKVSGDWEDSDRGAGNKAKKRAGGTVKAKSPTYIAHVVNKGKKKIDPNKNPVVEEKSKGEMVQELFGLGNKKYPYRKATKKNPRGKRDQAELDRAQAYLKKHPNFGKVSEAKVDKGRSDYGKASIRNYRRSGPGHGEPAMFDPDNKRGKLIDKRREEHKARRGVKGAKVPAYKLSEEGYDRMRDDRLVKYGIGHDGSDRKGSTRYHSRPDTPEQKKRKQAASDEAYKSVVAKLKKKYGDGVMTSSKKIRKGKEVK